MYNQACWKSQILSKINAIGLGYHSKTSEREWKS